MPRKKRTVAPGPVVSDVPQLPTLTQEELLRLRLLSTEEKLAAQEARLAVMERNAFLARVDPKNVLGGFEAKIQREARAQVEAKKAYDEHLARVSARLGIDLKAGYLIDPETGAAAQVEKPPQE
jgi:hypothetical protein